MALPNLRRLFVEARTEAEENEYSRNAVSTTFAEIMKSRLATLRQLADPGSINSVLQSGFVYIVDCCFQSGGTADEWGD